MRKRPFVVIVEIGMQGSGQYCTKTLSCGHHVVPEPPLVILSVLRINPCGYLDIYHWVRRIDDSESASPSSFTVPIADVVVDGTMNYP